MAAMIIILVLIGISTNYFSIMIIIIINLCVSVFICIYLINMLSFSIHNTRHLCKIDPWYFYLFIY